MSRWIDPHWPLLTSLTLHSLAGLAVLHITLSLPPPSFSHILSVEIIEEKRPLEAETKKEPVSVVKKKVEIPPVKEKRKTPSRCNSSRAKYPPFCRGTLKSGSGCHAARAQKPRRKRPSRKIESRGNRGGESAGGRRKEIGCQPSRSERLFFALGSSPPIGKFDGTERNCLARRIG